MKNIFSTSSKRGPLFRKHVSKLSVKLLCETRWEYRIDSVKALRYQLPEIYDALDELAEEASNAIIQSEAKTLYETLKPYKVLVSLVLWYDVLFQVNFLVKNCKLKK